MIPIIDFERRSKEGPLMKTDEFDLNFTKKVRELVKKYSITYNPEELIVEESTADVVFQAGVELLTDVGLYNLESQRTVQFTKEEILEMCRKYKESNPSVTFGKGKDVHTIAPRNGNEKKPPILWASVGNVPEDMFIPYVRMTAEDEAVTGFGMAGGIPSVKGIVPVAGNPSEIYCVRWEVDTQLEALRRADRPDMHLGHISTASTTGATAAVLGDGLREPHNTQVSIHIMPDQKIDYTRLNLSLLIEQYGIQPHTSSMSMIGGLCGNAAGVAIGLIANLLGQLAFGHGKFASIFASDMVGKNSERPALWAFSAATRAAARNIGIPVGTCMSGGGCFSLEELQLRNFITAVALTGNGSSYCWAAGSTSTEYRVFEAISKGIAGMEASKVNTILNTYASKLEEMAKAGGTPLGYEVYIPFPSKYDIETFKPTEQYTSLMNNVVDSLGKLGIPFSSDFRIF